MIRAGAVILAALAAPAAPDRTTDAAEPVRIAFGPSHAILSGDFS